jgi:hypothetical protein
MADKPALEFAGEGLVLKGLGPESFFGVTACEAECKETYVGELDYFLWVLREPYCRRLRLLFIRLYYGA